MSGLAAVYRYPTNVLYQKGEAGTPIEYYVTSVFACERDQIDLYWEIIRVSDKAVQILRTDSPGTILLYADRQFKIHSNIYITDSWSHKKMHEIKIEAPKNGDATI
ncbi:MAG: hypothetical protein K1X28_06145 [Parachlamydiales bacterium]|nr:hypothetical protein [Parachlamydiales bacterium]